jgi:hypothetical protein
MHCKTIIRGLTQATLALMIMQMILSWCCKSFRFGRGWLKPGADWGLLVRDLSSGGREPQAHFYRAAANCFADYIAIYIFYATLCFGLGTTIIWCWQAKACLRAAHKTAICRNRRSRTGGSVVIG